MKKILITILTLLLLPVYAQTDKTSVEYLQNKWHFSPLNPIVEGCAQKVIKKSIKKEVESGKIKVNFDGYTLSSLKKGIFKNLEIVGKNIISEGIPIPFFRIKTVSDYNWIDYTKKPILVKTDMEYAYEVKLSEESINKALEHKDYCKKIQKINKKAYPLFTLQNAKVKIINDKMRIFMDYTLPLSSSMKVRTFVVSTKFKAENGKIYADEITIDKSYGNISVTKVANLINLLDPLSFTLSLLDDKKCKGKIENIKINDNLIQINGKIFVKGEL